MTVKVGDIVRFRGRNVRVMQIAGSTTRVSYYGDVDYVFDDSELVTSIHPPKLEIGDKVIIRPIPGEEQKQYGAGWVSVMVDCFNETFVVHDVWNNDITGTNVSVGGWIFQIYHLELVHNYDII